MSDIKYMDCAASQSENAIEFIRTLGKPCLADPATGDESLIKAFSRFFRFCGNIPTVVSEISAQYRDVSWR
jgi:hypothetical protein